MQNLYSDSWELYKAITEEFCDDVDFYRDFIGDNHALELFAGFGRVTNQLSSAGTSLETVEIMQEFSDDIRLPESRKHVCDVLDFTPIHKFNRIFAAYNSFCLFTKDSQIKRFVHSVDDWLQPDGLVSLSYYHPDFWDQAVSFNFDFKGKKIAYQPSYDLSERANGIGYWIDRFEVEGQTITHSYKIKIYETENCIKKIIKDTRLELVDTVENFNKPNPVEPGWIDFILKKRS